MNIRYSVVVPLKNEAENVLELLEELKPVMKEMGADWEVLCIDDGSTDQTLAILQNAKIKYPELRLISFDRNYGQSSAFDAGFKAARGEFIITLDGDRQNDPTDIPRLAAAMHGADLVCGERTKRRDPWIKRLTSRLANGVRSRVCGDGVKDTGCSLKIYRAKSLRSVKMFHGMHRFLPALFQIEGFKVLSVPVNHRERTKGLTKYNFFNRSFNTVFDMLAVRWMKKRRLHYKIELED